MKKLLTLFLISCALIACRKDRAQYIGNWEGIYNGSDSGIFTFTVDANLKASGEIISRVTNGRESFDGTVYSDGKIILNSGLVYAGTSFKGHLSVSTGNGTWLGVGFCGGCVQSGNWTCTKR